MADTFAVLCAAGVGTECCHAEWPAMFLDVLCSLLPVVRRVVWQSLIGV